LPPIKPKINPQKIQNMKKVSYLMLALMLAFFISCNKDQKVVKELDGTWTVTSATTNGQPDPSFNGAKYSFTKCKVKKEECDGTIMASGFTIPFKYKVTDKGTKITITTDFLGQKDTQNATITEHSKSKMVFTSTDNNETTVITMTK
jgi:hypothetical protein